jgi:hypothetical protein
MFALSRIDPSAEAVTLDVMAERVDLTLALLATVRS